VALELLAEIDCSPYRGAVFCNPRWLDIALMLLILVPYGVPPPARLPAAFHFASTSSGA